MKCPRCGAVNPGTRDYCRECDEIIARNGKLLEEAKAKDLEEKAMERLLEKSVGGDVDRDSIEDEVSAAVSDVIDDFFEN